MKPRRIQRPYAFTLLELMVVLAIIVIVLFVVVPRAPHRDRELAHRIQCLSNQKQVTLGLILFAGDHGDAFPAQVSTTNGGAAEPMSSGDVIPCYVVLTNYTTDPNVFRCPTDKGRPAAVRGQPITRTNVSYFISLGASVTNSPVYIILTGDRHLSVDAKPVGPGMFILTTNQAMAWTTELHSTSKTPMGGVFTFADGHGETVTSKSLARIVDRQNMPTNRLAFP